MRPGISRLFPAIPPIVGKNIDTAFFILTFRIEGGTFESKGMMRKMTGPRVAPEERIVPGRLARLFIPRGLRPQGGGHGYINFRKKIR